MQNLKKVTATEDAKREIAWLAAKYDIREYKVVEMLLAAWKANHAPAEVPAKQQEEKGA